MAAEASTSRQGWNACRYRSGAATGHYESWFQRANHPTRPLAFWIRYTIFSPAGRPADAVGELWAIYFDGERNRKTAVKEAVPIADCHFDSAGLFARIAAARLDASRLEGSAALRGNRLRWMLDYHGGGAPLLLLPRALYDRPLPRAKALVGSPNASFDGTIEVNGEAVSVDGWRGSQNHNWGSRHTDSYAWGQVAGFDGADDVFLECSTAQLRIGPLWTPRMSLVVLRLGGEEIALNGLAQSLIARGRVDDFDWRIRSRSRAATVTLRIHAPRRAFVALNYDNPPGGSKTCLNTKLAACALTLTRPRRAPEQFTTAHRAAFEILTDRGEHGIPVVA